MSRLESTQQSCSVATAHPHAHDCCHEDAHHHAASSHDSRHQAEASAATAQAKDTMGFSCCDDHSHQAGESVASAHAHAHSPWPMLAVAAVAAIGAEAVGWLAGPEWLAMVLAVLAIGLSGLGVYRQGLASLFRADLNINALMSIAVTGAVVLGHWPEAAMVMVLFAIAEAIEEKSLDRARHAISRLMEVAPQSVWLADGQGAWRETAAAQIQVGDLLRVKPGERIGLDGRVVQGLSSVNQAPITGESVPVEKEVGSSVYAGTINGMAELQYRVTAAFNDTTLARIISAVQEAQSSKAPIQRFVDRFARIYTPIVCGLAVAIAVLPPLVTDASWTAWAYKALVLLVIACPCALVISTPVAVVSGLAAAARHGILIKGGVFLEQGRKLRWLLLDKTGTLTTGRPGLTDFIALDPSTDVDRSHVLASALGARSDHPVSLAISAHQLDESRMLSTPPNVEAFEAVQGNGVRGTIDGQRYFLGSPRWLDGVMSQENKNAVHALQEQGRTVAVLATAQTALAAFGVADEARQTSREAVEVLHRLGLRTAMVSGDNAVVADRMAIEMGIDQVHAGLLPEEKLAVLEDYARQGAIGMVGDGINDAPALARADIGFAMGAMGTDTAIETADVALMDDDLRKIATFIRLSRTTHGILIQNITAALGIKLVFVALTLAGLGTMWMAVFADVGASLLVVANSLRLLRK